MQKIKLKRTVIAILFLFITLFKEIWIWNTATAEAAVETYFRDDHLWDSVRTRKTFGLVAENVRDVKLGKDTAFSGNLYISQREGEYRYIDFATKLKTKRNGIYYNSSLVTRNAKELIPVSCDLFMVDSKNQLRLTTEDNVYWYKDLLGNKKGKSPYFEILVSKKKVKCWVDDEVFSFVRDNTLHICANGNEKVTEQKYFKGKANKIKKVVVGENESDSNDYNLFVLFKNGDVYGMGSNKYHLISDSDDKFYEEFTKIDISGVQDILACQGSVAVQKKNGSLWMWGERRTGKQHKTKEYPVKPYKIADQVEEFSLSANGEEGRTCSVLFLKNGTAYGWGSNKKYVMTSANRKIWHQKPVKLKSGIKHIYSADNMSFLLDQKGNLYWSGVWDQNPFDFSFSWVEKKILGKK